MHLWHATPISCCLKSQSLSPHPHADGKSGEVSSPPKQFWNSQQIRATAFSTTEEAGDLFPKTTK